MRASFRRRLFVVGAVLIVPCLAGLVPARAAAPLPPCIALARSVAAAHPLAAVARARGRAEEARATAEGALPPPMSEFEIWDFPVIEPATAPGRTMFMLGIEQRLPLGDLRGSARLAGRQAAAAMRLEGRVAQSEIALGVAGACVDWSAAADKAAALDAQAALMAQALAALEALRASGTVGPAPTARAAAELATAERMAATAHIEVDGARRVLLALAGPEGAGGAVPEVAPALETLSVPLDALGEAAGEAGAGEAGAPGLRPELAQREAAIAAAEAAARAAKVRTHTPELTLGGALAYSPGMSPGIVARVGLELPWGSSERAARVEAARAEVIAARAEREAAGREVAAEVEMARAQLATAEAALAALNGREVPALMRAATLDRAGLVAGSFDLAGWIDAARALRQARVEASDYAAARARAAVALWRATGQLVLVDGEGRP